MPRGMASTLRCSNRNRGFFAAVLAAWLVPAQAAEITIESGAMRVPVVELYTSEGCSSCPPADAWIGRLGETLGEELRAVPLAFHVDYWNYLGWDDPFSSPEYTQRQRFLGALNAQSSIYTPEFLVSGRETRGTRAVVGAIREANAQPAVVTIRAVVTRDADEVITAEVDIDGDTAGAALYFAVFENGITREIGAGENHGRTLNHDFVVRDFREVALPDPGNQAIRVSIPVEDDWNRSDLGLAVMVMDRRDSHTRQALSTPLESLFAGG